MNFSFLAIILLLSIPFIFVYGDQMGRLALELEDSPGSGTFTEVWFHQGNQGNGWEQFTVDLSAEDNSGQRQLRFVALEIMEGVRSDMAVDGITIQGVAGINPETPRSITFEDFETGFITWINTEGDDNNCWSRDSSGTPSNNTGPSTGAEGSTWYVYYESSEFCSPGTGQQAYLLGPVIDFNVFKDVEVKLWRHMWNNRSGITFTDLDFMVYKGIQYYKLRDYQQAIPIFKDVLKIDKKNSQALLNLGHSYFSLEKYNMAIKIYEHVLSIDPNNSDALYQLQLALLKTASYWSATFDGLLEIRVHDSNGGLVAYLQSTQMKALKHSISEKLIESWPVSKTIHRNNQDYSIHQNEFVEVITKNTILGFHEIPLSDKMDLPMASTWHYQIPVKKGDVVTYTYSIFRPLD